VILDIRFKLAAILKQHLATNLMKSAPLFVIRWWSQFVLKLGHEWLLAQVESIKQTGRRIIALLLPAANPKHFALL
jgi:hypothetical protein